MGTEPRIKKSLAALALSCLIAGPALADRAEFQLGYVFDLWNSNFISSGQEHRIPASFHFSSKDFNLWADGAFVVGDYEQTATGASPASSYKPSQLSDSSLSASYSFHLGPSVLSTASGSVNFPTGDTTWESQSASGAIPYLFEPSFYHGRGWGGSLFWSVAASGDVLQWSLGAGYLLTTTYDIGLAGQSQFNPGDSLLAVGSLGGNVSQNQKLAVRAVHTFAFESKVTDPLSQFTSAESTVVSGQWLDRMGDDRLALNLSYSFYGLGMMNDPLTGQQVRESSNFLGDRLEVKPFLGWQAGTGLDLQSGIVWDRIFPNGYPESDTGHFQAGGFLLGAEQSMTFDMGAGLFLNLAGLYHFVLNEKAAQDTGTGAWYNVTYNRFSFGTNVGFQW